MRCEPRLLVGVAVALLARSAAAQQSPTAPDLPRLFSTRDGSLSPGYPARHAASTAAPLEVIEHGSSRAYVAVLFNPALAPLGKWSARIEIAPLPAHALFVEGSLLNLSSGLTGYSDDIRGRSLDIGYHLYPLGRGLDGLYLGPRIFFGSGSTDLAVGKVFGYGGDIGYQWVFGPVALNVGIGAAYAKVSVDASGSVPAGFAVPPEYVALLSQPIDQALVIPVATLGLGFAF